MPMPSPVISRPRTECLPRISTPRNPDRKTLGGAVAKVAELLGKPLMPWQRHVADVALEVDPATGLLFYTEVRLLVPRQSGKSTLVKSVGSQRCSATGYFGGRQSVIYTAQTRAKARQKWEDDFAFDLRHSKAFGTVKLHLGNGNEHMTFPNGSRWGIEAGTEKAGHGDTLDLAFVDEAFAQPDGRLEQAFRPAMITRKSRQLWIVSTAGWLGGSPYLEAKVSDSQERAELGEWGHVAYFEWSAGPDEDPADPATWWGCMPALGHTITEEAIAAEFDSMELHDFRRAFLNQWVTKMAGEPSVIDPQVWGNAAAPGAEMDSPRFAVDMGPDRDQVVIAAAGTTRDARVLVEVVDARPGTGWVAPRLTELLERHGRGPVYVQAAGPAQSLVADLEAAGIEVHQVAGREYAAACMWLVDNISEGFVCHLGDPSLTAAVGAARKRHSGDVWTWNRRAITDDISELVAVTLAAAAVTGTPVESDPALSVH